MKCQAYLFFRQFRVCIWQKKTAVFLRIPLACSVDPKWSPPQSMASSYWPTDHTICFPFHHSLMSETGLPLSPTCRTLRNHHHCHGPLSNQQPLGKRPAGLLGESWLLKMLKTAWEIWRAPPRLLWLKSWMSNSVCLCLYLLARSLEKVCGPVLSLVCVGEPWQP